MYERLTISTGVEAVHKYTSLFTTTLAADGVVFAPPDTNAYFGDISIPDRLRQWLVDIRLLRHIPIAYYVPDAELLPPESIRFFNVDPTWMDRIVDGVLAAANTGTVDTVFSASVLGMVRTALDAELTAIAQASVANTSWTGAKPMTGMLIRSELVRRWPNMIVRAYTAEADNFSAPSTAPVLRAEPISKDLYIALFGGSPAMVHVREPNVGVRFGIEENPPGSTTWVVDKRASNGAEAPGSVTVSPRNAQKRTLDIAKLAQAVGAAPRMVALHLEQKPYVQEFKLTAPEDRGSLPLSNYIGLNGKFISPALRKGRVMNLAPLQKRLTQIQQLHPEVKP